VASRSSEVNFTKNYTLLFLPLMHVVHFMPFSLFFVFCSVGFLLFCLCLCMCGLRAFCVWTIVVWFRINGMECRMELVAVPTALHGHLDEHHSTLRVVLVSAIIASTCCDVTMTSPSHYVNNPNSITHRLYYSFLLQTLQTSSNTFLASCI